MADTPVDDVIYGWPLLSIICTFYMKLGENFIRSQVPESTITLPLFFSTCPKLILMSIAKMGFSSNPCNGWALVSLYQKTNYIVQNVAQNWAVLHGIPPLNVLVVHQWLLVSISTWVESTNVQCIKKLKLWYNNDT